MTHPTLPHFPPEPQRRGCEVPPKEKGNEHLHPPPPPLTSHIVDDAIRARFSSVVHTRHLD